MSKALRLTKVDMQRAMILAQAGCRVTFHPDSSVSVEAVDASAEKEPDSVTEWRRKRDAQKLGGRNAHGR
jgi:hypothetical protein